MTNSALTATDCDAIIGCGALADEPCLPGCPLADADLDAALLQEIEAPRHIATPADLTTDEMRVYGAPGPHWTETTYRYSAAWEGFRPVDLIDC